MELSDFISTTLNEIMKGVTKAAEVHRASGRFGFINPMDGHQNDDFSSIPISQVGFDVAITAEVSTAGKAGGSVNVKVIEASFAGDKSERVTGESRVQFSVPVCLPTTKLRKDH